MAGRFVSYLRVSTDRQGKSGLGLKAQRESVTRYLNGGEWTLLGEFVEVESGKRDDRPQLAAALEYCKLTGATLVVAKLDRLARDAHFLLGLQKAGVEFVATDMPHANRLTVGIMAMVAEEEARMISARTKAALAAKKAQGHKLGGYRLGAPKVDGTLGTAAKKRKADEFAAAVGPITAALRDEGLSLRAIASALKDRGIRTPQGGAWTATAVRNVLARAA
jgi:DNA invertase Pin-like site-specific DNA recombinase